MKECTHITCMVFFVLVGAEAFGLVFRGMKGDAYMTSLIMDANLSTYAFLALVLVMIFIAGFFIDFIQITYIIVPVVTPIFIAFGVDLLWLGILIAVNLQTSFLTPPFGFSLFLSERGSSARSAGPRHIYRGNPALHRDPAHLPVTAGLRPVHGDVAAGPCARLG